MNCTKTLYLSIIIPAYNEEKYILPCIESIISNVKVEPENFEIIVVNDGSSDRTSELVEEFINYNPYFQITLLNQKNSGVSIARNLGIKTAKGIYIWFIDADDAIADCSIHVLSKIIEEKNIDVIKIGDCVGKVLYNDDNESIKTYKIVPDYSQYIILASYKLLDEKHIHGHTTYIWKRSFLIQNEILYPAGISENEDLYFLICGLLAADEIYINNTFQFYIYRERDISVSRGKFDFLRLDKLFTNKFLVLDLLLKFPICHEHKSVFLKHYIDQYLYSIVAISFLVCTYPSIILHNIARLKALKLYPIAYITSVSKFRIWIFNHRLFFWCAYVLYRIIVRFKKDYTTFVILFFRKNDKNTSH